MAVRQLRRTEQGRSAQRSRATGRGPDRGLLFTVIMISSDLSSRPARKTEPAKADIVTSWLRFARASHLLADGFCRTASWCARCSPLLDTDAGFFMLSVIMASDPPSAMAGGFLTLNGI